MPPKNKKNKRTQKLNEETTPTQATEENINQNDQGFSQAMHEEEKLPETIQTENQTTQPDETLNEQTEGSQVKLTTEPEETLSREPEAVIEPTTIAENIDKINIEEEKPVEKEKEEPLAINEEAVIEPVEERKEEPLAINEEAVIEPVKERKEEPLAINEEAVIEPLEERNEEKPVEANETQSENRLFTIEGEPEQGELNETKGGTFGASVITEGNEQESQDVTEKKEQEDQYKTVTEEISQSILETKDDLQKSQGLASSLQEKWEEMHPQKEIEAQESATNTSAPQYEGASVDLQGSLQQNWEVVGKRSSLVVHGNNDNEEIRSDKASDNAIQTRLMDDYTESTISISKEPSTVELTPEERLRKAVEQINEAKTLKDTGKAEEAILLLLSSFELLNPSNIQSHDANLLTSVNQRIHECTLEIADCYNQLNDFNQSIRYARIILKTNPENIRAVYLLGIGLIRIGDLDEAHSLLKESKNFSASADPVFVNLIDKELEKLDQIAESKSKTPRASSYIEEHQPILVRNTTSSVDKVPEENPEEQKENKKSGAGKSSAAEYFLGSLVSTGAVGFVVAKYLLKFPTKKGLVASLVVGAVVGGVSLIVHSSLGKNDKGKTEKK